MRRSISLLAATSAIVLSTPALADEESESSDAIEVKPHVDIVMRYESVAQDNAAGDADALTVRARAGLQLKKGGFSILAEAEGTAELVNDFNNTIPSDGIEPFSVVADPGNFELNRLQADYTSGSTSVTIGRQRIIHPGARWVGNVGWRQNEQTYDAIRAKTKVGPVKLDATYAIAQRTIFGERSPNEEFEGDFILLRGDIDLKPITITAFSYTIDYDTRLAFSSQTYGVEAKAAIPAGPVKLNAKASYATQSDVGDNPTDYSADYISVELGGSVSGFGLKAGYEELGSDGGIAGFQTPLATLHAYNGFADLFLATPATGLRDSYITASKAFKVKAIPGLKAAVTYHEFDSDVGGIDYGSEVDAVLSFKLGKFGILAKYASYNANGFGVDTEKFWLQAGIKF